MLTIEKPAILLLIVFFPLLIYLFYVRKNRGGGIPYSFKVWQGRSIIYAPPSLNLIYIITEVLLWLAILSFLFALSGPAVATNRKTFVGRGIDMMIVLDQSPSMAARDFGAEDRLTTAREMIKEFIRGRENDSLGLITFSEEAVLRLPPTVDHALLQNSLEEVTLINKGDGTAIGMGVALGVLHLSTSTAKEKVILLITDGENNVGEIQPETAASMAAQLNIRIYSIGLGTTGEVPVEFVDSENGKIITGTIMSKFDGTLLKKISQLSGGSYFYARSSGSLETIFQTIDTIETHDVRTKISVTKRFFYQELIIMGFILFFLHWIIRKVIMGEIL